VVVVGLSLMVVAVGVTVAAREGVAVGMASKLLLLLAVLLMHPMAAAGVIHQRMAVAKAARHSKGSDGDDDGDGGSTKGRGNGSTFGGTVDGSQLKAAAAGLVRYFKKHHMQECVKLVRAIEQQLEL
jgi:hypothetical protein